MKPENSRKKAQIAKEQDIVRSITRESHPSRFDTASQYDNGYALDLADKLCQVLMADGMEVDRRKDTIHAEVKSVLSSFKVSIYTTSSNDAWHHNPTGFRITFNIGDYRYGNVRGWVGISWNSNLKCWEFSKKKAIAKTRGVIKSLDNWLTSEQNAAQAKDQTIDRLKKMFPGYEIKAVFNARQRASIYSFSINTKTVRANVHVPSGFGSGKTDDIILVSVRLSSLQSPRGSAENIIATLEAFNPETYNKPPKSKNLPQKVKSGRKVKDSVCTYLRLEDHTHLSYKEIAEMVKAELGSKTTAESVAWYYSKYRKTEKLLARTKPDDVIVLGPCAVVDTCTKA